MWPLFFHTAMKSAIVASMEKKGIVCHCYGDATDLHLMLRNIHKNIQRHYFLNSRISVCDSNQSLLFFFFLFILSIQMRGSIQCPCLFSVSL